MIKILRYELVNNRMGFWSVLFMVSFFIASCGKEKLDPVGDIPGLGGDVWVRGPLDQWLYDSLTVPYNIATKYKWDQFELEVNKTLVPPKEEKVIPVMRAVKNVWIQPYIDEAGALFFKRYCPKFFVLAGSPSFNLDGSVTLGTAEGGRKVVLYELNNFKTKSTPGYVLADTAVPKQMFHVIEHEFTHILDQNIQRSVQFDLIGKGLYTTDWINTNDYLAQREGFITAYAMSSPAEDFAEMVSIMLIEGRPAIDNLINSITGTSAAGTPAAVAKSRLRQKEALVVDYFKQAWNINFYNLQLRTRFAIERELF